MTMTDVRLDPVIAVPLRVSGGVWGLLVGDAMGMPYEFRGRRP